MPSAKSLSQGLVPGPGYRRIFQNPAMAADFARNSLAEDVGTWFGLPAWQSMLTGRVGGRLVWRKDDIGRSVTLRGAPGPASA